MRAIASIARYTFLQQMRNRLYLVVGFFAVLVLGVSLLFSALAPDQEVRVTLDFGLATAEIFGIVAAVFGAVTLILEEMESRTLYLILTRPLPRAYYIIGRFLGLLAAVIASLMIMNVLHVALLLTQKWAWDYHYFACLPFIYFKVIMVAALAVFFSLFSTSSVSSVVFTFFFWVLGHFGSELSFLLKKSGNVATVFLVRAVMFIMPNFQFLNYQDIFQVPGVSLGHQLWGLAYAAIYTAACLALSIALFLRKEF